LETSKPGPPTSFEEPAVDHLGTVAVRRLGGISMLHVRGCLSAIAGPTHQAVLTEWVRAPAAVVVDLAGVNGPVDPGAVSELASLGILVRQWPGIPIGVMCPDRDLRARLASAREGEHLAIAHIWPTVRSRLSAGNVTATVRAELPPEARSAGAAREVASGACTEWGYSHQIPTATLITSELVTNAVLHAGTPLEVTVSHCDSRLRIAVRDHSLQPPALTRVESVATTGRGMQLVAALCQDWGVVTTPGGKLVWAVLTG
jgi:anti-sigma regulatory factor (Ser/Thr protein kinase)